MCPLVANVSNLTLTFCILFFHFRNFQKFPPTLSMFLCNTSRLLWLLLYVVTVECFTDISGYSALFPSHMVMWSWAGDLTTVILTQQKKKKKRGNRRSVKGCMYSIYIKEKCDPVLLILTSAEPFFVLWPQRCHVITAVHQDGTLRYYVFDNKIFKIIICSNIYIFISLFLINY